MKKILVLLLFIVFTATNSYADCRGCCSGSDGIVCNNGVTECVDGTPLSEKCKNKGCSACENEINTSLSIASFNLMWLGHFTKKEHTALAHILKDYDIVVIQELVSPPVDGRYPNGDAYKADSEAEDFFNAMQNLGFNYLLSEEDTGTNPIIHNKNSSTEWWVAFYKPTAVNIANDIPSGFLSNDRSDNPDYERVPYAFSFRTVNNNLDFVLISVHLQPGKSSSDKERRIHEISSIKTWIDANDNQEKDFIILGDMNIYSQDELNRVMPQGYVSLNDECLPTVTSGTGMPYDHVMYNTTHTKEIDTQYDLKIIDLIETMKPYWTYEDDYPGEPYDHNLFKQYYSDHHPIVFKMVSPANDDD
jgi:hypothetical protein